MSSVDARRARRLPVAVPVPSRLDAAIAAVFVVLTVAEAVLSPGVTSPVLHLVVVGAAMASLAWRRHAPIVVAILVISANLAVNPDGQFSVLLSLVLVCFTIGYETAPPRSYVGLAVVVVPFVVLSTVNGLEASDLAAALVFFVGPWAVGGAVRQRADKATAAQERAERLERERETALQEERTRIARELHDIVSHAISVVTIQTQAVRRRLPPEQSREAADLAAVETTAREALAEMRRLFGVLRADGESASLTPQPGLGELERLVQQVRSSGLDVRVETTGDRYELPPGVDLAAYRIVQEGLTNALRHSGARRATVHVGYGAQVLDVAVEDDGNGLPGGWPAADATGHGLVGVRERVALYGGTVDLGRSSGGGVRLSASLPVRDDA